MLKDLRMGRAMTQMELADRVGIGQPTVSGIECGRVSPSVAVLHNIAEALSLSDHERAALLAWAAEQAESRREAA